MKSLVFGIGILAAVSSLGPRAEAQNYPWCEYLGGGMGGGGGRNCGFVSFEQCMQSAWGNGGDCRQNTQYEPPPGPHDGPAATVVTGSHHRHHVTKKSQNNS